MFVHLFKGDVPHCSLILQGSTGSSINLMPSESPYFSHFNQKISASIFSCTLEGTVESALIIGIPVLIFLYLLVTFAPGKKTKGSFRWNFTTCMCLRTQNQSVDESGKYIHQNWHNHIVLYRAMRHKVVPQ